MLILDEYKLRINALDAPIEELSRALDIDGIKNELADLEKQTEAEDFWGDLENSQVVLKRISRIKEKIAKFDSFVSDLADIRALFELAEEAEDEEAAQEVGELLAALEKALADARIETLLSGDYDANNAIMSFQAGAGGTEAQDWAEMLYRMYTRYGERKKFKVKVLNSKGKAYAKKTVKIKFKGKTYKIKTNSIILTLCEAGLITYLTWGCIFKKFKEKTGYTPIKYLAIRKIDEAKRLLETTDLPISEVMERVGYEDASYFSKLFKKLVGYSPKSFRENVEQKQLV